MPSLRTATVVIGRVVTWQAGAAIVLASGVPGYRGARTPEPILVACSRPCCGRHRSLAGVEGCPVQTIDTTVAESPPQRVRNAGVWLGNVLDPFERAVRGSLARLGTGFPALFCPNPNSRVTFVSDFLRATRRLAFWPRRSRAVGVPLSWANLGPTSPRWPRPRPTSPVSSRPATCGPRPTSGTTCSFFVMFDVGRLHLPVGDPP